MDIGALSMIMSQSRAQQSASVAVMKIAMDTGKEAKQVRRQTSSLG